MVVVGTGGVVGRVGKQVRRYIQGKGSNQRLGGGGKNIHWGGGGSLRTKVLFMMVRGRVKVASWLRINFNKTIKYLSNYRKTGKFSPYIYI